MRSTKPTISFEEHLIKGQMLFVGALCLLFLLSSCSSSSVKTEKATQTADELFLQAVSYKRAGRIELCRTTLNKAIEKDKSGKVGPIARAFMIRQLPKQSVALEAEQRNIIGFNQAANGDLVAAKTTFRNLIHDFPDFEWPYANLALICIKENRIDEAEQLLTKALTINPNYVNGWTYLARVKHTKHDFQGEHECIKKKIDLDLMMNKADNSEHF